MSGRDEPAPEPELEAEPGPEAQPGPEAGTEPEAGTGAASAPEARRAWPPVPPERLEPAVEALLLAAGDVLSPERVRDLLGLASVVHVREAVERISERWRGAALPVEIQEVAGGWRVVTRPEQAEYVLRLARRQAADRLTTSQLETLSIVAYRQPVPRVEVERIRGVQAGEALRALLERRLIKVAGRSDQPGRPLLYGTTRRFLEVFGLAGLKDLPASGDLSRM